ncbi:MAG: ThiF family adenylyltransferase [Nanoarchaeota archaeon]|nr:ThiF family adenylyltransferase [Nanoarchaeota archaeon]
MAKKKKATTGLMIEEERYIRQKAIWGDEGQAKLQQARVAVVGLGPQGVYHALCLTALGVGNVVLVDGSSVEPGEMFLDMNVPEGARAEKYPDLLQRVNPQVNVEGYATNLASRIDQLALEASTAIVDTTNSPRSKEFAISFGQERNIPILSTSGKWGYTKLMMVNDPTDPANLMSMFEGYEQDPLMALAMCGPGAEEVKKLILGEMDSLLREPVRYRLGDGYRFGFLKPGEEVPKPDPKIYQGLSALVKGAGALGCWGAITLSHMGLGRADQVDYDVFESHNANRQILAYDGIDELKAAHVATKIRTMSRGQTESDGINEMILPGFKPARQYDVVFDFVDNPYTRAINTGWTVTGSIPMISSGALPNSARWNVHVPGKTACMDCIMNIYEEGRKAEMIRRASCAANPDPSVVMSNAIGAVNGVLDLYTIFEPEKFGQPFNGEQTYRATTPRRFGTSPRVDACDCYGKSTPNLEITPEQIDAFVAEHPHLLTDA